MFKIIHLSIKWNHIVWSVEKIQKTKIQKFRVLVMVGQWYYQNVQYVVVKNQEAEGLLSNLDIKAPLNKVPVLGDILFWMCILNCIYVSKRH